MGAGCAAAVVYYWHAYLSTMTDSEQAERGSGGRAASERPVCPVSRVEAVFLSAHQCVGAIRANLTHRKSRQKVVEHNSYEASPAGL